MMKTTVIKASKAGAEEIAKDLLSNKTSKGTPLFERREIDHGFELFTFIKKVETVVFRFTDPGGMPRFDYDERLLTFY